MHGSFLYIYQSFSLEILPYLRKYNRVNSKVGFEVTYIDGLLLSIDACSLHPHKSESAAHHLIRRVNKKNHLAAPTETSVAANASRYTKAGFHWRARQDCGLGRRVRSISYSVRLIDCLELRRIRAAQPVRSPRVRWCAGEQPKVPKGSL